MPTIKTLTIILISYLLANFSVTAKSDVKAKQINQNTSITIGIIAYELRKSAKYWRSTATILTTTLAGYTFRIRQYQSPQLLAKALKNKEIEFVIVDPVNYVALEYHQGINAIATLLTPNSNQYTTQTGIVTFTRSSHKGIYKLSDLKNKRFVAFGVNTRETWWIQLIEFRQAGIDPYKDLSILRSEQNQDNVVFDVISGKYDAGSIQSGVLEQLAGDKKIDLGKIRVLNPKTFDHYPFQLSSDYYPNWSFAIAKHTNKQLGKKVLATLLHKTVIEGKESNLWSIPLNYTKVHDLLKKLQINPYQNYNKIKPIRIARKYWYLLVLALFSIIAALYFLYKHRIATHQLNKTSIALNDSRSAIEDIILHDNLTQLSNRRVLDKDLSQEWWRACREKSPISTMIIDLDHFSEYNNTHGHAAGDECLIRVAKLIKNMFKRSFDITARYGDDEFLIVLPNTNITDCWRLAQSLHKEIEKLGLGASIGIATMTPEQGSVPDSLIAAADAALHNSKKKGENLITSAPLAR